MPCPAVRSRRGGGGEPSGLARCLVEEGGWAGLPGRGLEEGGRAVSCGAAARHAPSARGAAAGTRRRLLLLRFARPGPAPREEAVG